MTAFRHTLVNHFLEYSAEKSPDKVAVVHQGKRITYGEIEILSNKLAGALRECGVERGDRVAIFMDNSIEAIISIFASLKTGAAFMPINHTTKAERLEFILNNSRSKLVLMQGSRDEVMQKIKCPYLETVVVSGSHNVNSSCVSFDDIMSSPDGPAAGTRCIDMDLASIVYTSGSTGSPKGVMLSHRNMVSAADSITAYLENDEHDIILDVLPISFTYGLSQILTTFRVGGTVVLEKSFAYPYHVINTMVKERVTGFPGVPTIFALLLQTDDVDKCDFSSLRYITNAAAALPVPHIRRLRELFPKVKIYSMYGQTECIRISYLPHEDIDDKPESVGKGMPNEEVYIMNEKGERAGPHEAGELVVRGSHVMLGYWDLPEETEKHLRSEKHSHEKVLYTGDLFRMDDEGYLYFIARADDIIKCKGEKVSPREVENVLYSIRGVMEAAVIGVPDKINGQSVKAFVVLDADSQLTDKDILRHCSKHLTDYMIPKYVEMRGSLPKTASGKIMKRLLLDVTN